MISITLENGQVLMCEKLVGCAFRAGKSLNIVDGGIDLVDVLYAKDVMLQHEHNIVNAELERRAIEGGQIPPKIAISKAGPLSEVKK